MAPTQPDAGPTPDGNVLFLKVIVPSACTLAVVWAVAWLAILQAFPAFIVECSLLFMPLVFLALGAYTMNLFLLIGAGLSFAWAYYMWKYVEFTAKLFKAVSTAYTISFAIFGVAVGVIVLQGMTQVLFMFATVPLSLGADEKKGDSPGSTAILLMLSYYWTINVLRYTLHVSCCGVIARWYFNKDSENAVSASTGAACTSYFGSICLGSLIIAIIQTLKQIVKSACESDGDNAVGQVIKCVAMCVMNCIEYIAEFFTTYTFVIISIYGLSFMKAGKATYELMKQGGIEVLTQYQLAGSVSLFGSLAGGAVVAAASALVAASLQMAKFYLVLAAIVGFLAGLCTLMMVSGVVESGVDTLFICFIKEPLALQKARPELYDAFRERQGVSS